MAGHKICGVVLCVARDVAQPVGLGQTLLGKPVHLATLRCDGQTATARIVGGIHISRGEL